MKSFLLSLLLIFSATVAFAQRTVTGRVVDSRTGEELPGVNVTIKGTTNGTATDIEGRYSLSASDDAVLVFSYIGYLSQETQLGSRSVVDIKLEEDIAQLSEVVVIGYGQVEAKDATGALSSVKAEDFNGGVISSPEQLFQGKAAGVQITSNSGEPGAGVNIRIRGTASVRTGSNPLFVVDGVPLAGNDISAGGTDIGRGTSTAKNPLNFLNPNDIESIDILKDASATAIYGSRGANGVVIITTKSGKGQDGLLTYSNSLSISSPANTYDLLDAQAFLDGAEDRGAIRSELDQGNSTDWQEEVLRTSFSHNHDLSYANSYGSGNYRASFSYADQQGIVENSNMERLSGRLNLNHELMDGKLQLGARVTLSKVNDRIPLITDNAGFEGDILGMMIMANPTWSADPDDQQTGDVKSPTSLLKYYDDNTETNRSLLNFSVGYNITDDLNFKVNTGFDKTTSERGGGFSRDLILGNGVQGNGRAYISDKETSSNLLEAYLTYTKELGNSDLSLVAGYSYQEFIDEGNNMQGFGFNTSDIATMINDLRAAHDLVAGQITGSYQQFGNDASSLDIQRLFPMIQSESLSPISTPGVTTVTSDLYKTVNELQSFFGRVNYTIDGKYLFTATVRADGSTRFGENNAYGIFPSFAAAWRISDEAFAPEAFDDLKFRAGFGITGNQEIPHNVHQQRQRYGAIGIGNGGDANEGGIADVAFANPDLRWEQTQQINVGFDFALLGGKLNGAVDYYNKNTTDLLIQVFTAQPSPTPFNWENLDANVINKGVELTLNYEDLISSGDFDMDVGFNISHNTNEVTNYTGPDLRTGQINGQGLTGAFAQQISNNQPLYAYFLREFGGYDAEGVAIYPQGDVQQFSGKSPIPKVNLGFNINMNYKQFSLTSSFAGQYGHYIYSNTANAFFTAGALGNGRNVTADVLTSGESTINAPDVSTAFLEKGDFLRLQSVTLSYKFENTGDFIKSLSLFANGQNLFVITDYSGLDPEVNVNKALDGVPSLGIDYTAYPRARTISFGLNASF